MTAKIPTPRDRGLSRHDTFALLSENSLRYHEAYWALQ
jgi:acyl-CoA synthetase (AMP-forming)/AMP-acid ligase II